MVSILARGRAVRGTHVLAVRPSSLLGVLDLVEVVFVELPDERGKVAMLKVQGEDGARKGVHVLEMRRQLVRSKDGGRARTLTTNESPV